MGQFSKVLLAIDKVHSVPQRTLDCGLMWVKPGLWVQLSHSLCLAYIYQMFN